MPTDRVNFRKPFTQDDRNFNNAALAFGVVGTPCTMRTNVHGMELAEEAKALIAASEKVSSIEIYANGAMNLFIRKLGHTSDFEGPIGVIRIRPPVTGPLDQEIFGKDGVK